MSWLYACTIYPLQLFYKYVYLACIRVTGSYGLGLIGLSLCAAVAFVPLGRMAKKAKWKEDHLQDVMRPQIEKIKAQYTGAERQEAIARLYKRYSYHPLMTLRSAIGILLQFPFLTAAYKMVQELTILKGQSFWFIKDLSVADGLWGGVNALPIIMTLINFASIATAPNMRGKERVQAVVIALLFLWLLYGAPSALLIYWTCNNINYLAQNFVFHDKKEAEKSRMFSFSLFSGNELALGNNGHAVLNISLFVLLALIVSFFVFEIREVFDAFVKIAENDKTYLNVAVRRLYRCVLLVCSFPTLFFFKRLLEQKFTALEVLLKALLSGISFAALFFFTHHYLVPIGVPNINGGKFTLLLLCIVAYSLMIFTIAVPYSTLKIELERALGGQEHRIYIGSVFVAVLLLFTFCESELYYSDPSFFTESLPKLLLGLAPYAVGVFVLAVALFFIVPHGMKLMLAVMALFAVIILMLNTFVFSGNYGSLDVTMLSAPQSLYSKQNWYKDIGVLLIAATIISAVLKFRLVKVVCKILVFVCLSLGIFSGYAMFSTRFASQSAVSKQTHNLLPDFHDRLWGFSKEGKNVIIFFWDMFTGGHMQEILANRPELKKKLAGFVWYPDTLAVGQNTFLSAPSLLGGSHYLPPEWNKDYKTSNIDKLHKAYSVLPNAFLDAGFDVVIAGLPYADMKQLRKCLNNRNALLLSPSTWGKQYEKYWYKMLNRAQRVLTSDLSKFIVSVSLFRVAPSSLRASIYDNGNWRGVTRDVELVTETSVIKEMAPLQFMSTFSNVNVHSNTFKLFYSTLSHRPWHLPEKSLIPVADPYPATEGSFFLVNGVIPEHLYSENHMLGFLAQFCDWLKSEHIYDNTRIIIISDHDEADSNMLNSSLGGNWSGIVPYGQKKVYRGRAHALMLFKDFKATGDLTIDSEKLVSTEDLPAFACMDLFNIKTIPNRYLLEKLLKNDHRVRYHFGGGWRPQEHGANTMKYHLQHEVVGSIFNPQCYKY